jgi:hypothetical protein
MALDRRYLEWHGNQWRVQMKVPEKLRAVLGKAKLVKSLHTSSLAIANRERWLVVETFRKELREAEAKSATKAGQAADPLLKEAMEVREWLEAARQTP